MTASPSGTISLPHNPTASRQFESLLPQMKGWACKTRGRSQQPRMSCSAGHPVSEPVREQAGQARADACRWPRASRAGQLTIPHTHPKGTRTHFPVSSVRGRAKEVLAETPLLSSGRFPEYLLGAQVSGATQRRALQVLLLKDNFCRTRVSTHAQYTSVVFYFLDPGVSILQVILITISCYYY